MFKTLVFSVILLLLASACSLYESGGREAIEKNEGNLVSAYSIEGLSPDHKYYFLCSKTKDSPDFLNEALEVIETPFEKENISVLLNSRNAPHWLAIYRHNLKSNLHDQCKIYFFKNPGLHRKQLLAATQFGLSKIAEIEGKSAP